MRSKLKNWLSWQPHPMEVLTLMRPVKPWPVEMSLFSRGIDNTHIDVKLSPRFVARTQSLVRVMVRFDVARHYWNSVESQPTPSAMEDFRNGYRGLVDGATKRHQQFTEVEWVRLVQLSLLKFLLQLIPEQIQALRRHLETERDGAEAQQSGQRLEYHERLVVLARQESAIAYRVFQRLFKLAEKEESTQLRKLRKSLLGEPWPVPREALFNALLLPNLLGEEEVVHHYPMLCIEDQGRRYLEGLNRNLCEVFKDYLPSWTQAKAQHSADAETDTLAGKRGAAGMGGLQVTERLDQGGLRGFLETEIMLRHLLAEEEYKAPQFSWLDDPANLRQLLMERPPTGKGATAADGQLARHWRDYRRAVREELIRRIERLEIMPRIIASYWTPRIHQQLSEQVSARLIYDYLSGQRSKQKILRQLAAQRDLDPAQVVKTLDFAAGEIKQLSREKRRDYVLPVMHDILRLRRDLKLAYKTFEAMDQIRILSDADDINLSRSNGLLNEFNLENEQTEEKKILSHVILKADVRGSTRITSELRTKKLNPATHFSQNFFNPINEYLTDFGAGKVFVEGDAVILSFLEYANSSQRRLSVAHACGMASRILEVVARQNVVNRRHGLPELELGVGITFCDEEPAFLYDGNQQIMISPAINLADRLSSCTKVLRSAEFNESVRPFRVEVLLPAESADLPANSKTDVVRYNVNGIELDTAAFSKLKSELMMQRLEAKVGQRSYRFHVGSYPDLNGRIHWLAVRESPMRLWERGQISEKQSSERRFYEVVVEPFVVNQLRSNVERGMTLNRAVGSR